MKNFHHYEVTMPCVGSISGFSAYFLERDEADKAARHFRCRLLGLSFGEKKFDQEELADYGQTG